MVVHAAVALWHLNYSDGRPLRRSRYTWSGSDDISSGETALIARNLENYLSICVYSTFFFLDFFPEKEKWRLVIDKIDLVFSNLHEASIF